MNGIDQMLADVVRADVMPTDSEIALVVRCGRAVERVAARRALQAAARRVLDRQRLRDGVSPDEEIADTITAVADALSSLARGEPSNSPRTQLRIVSGGDHGPAAA